jgi:hypothetical protein
VEAVGWGAFLLQIVILSAAKDLRTALPHEFAAVPLA